MGRSRRHRIPPHPRLQEPPPLPILLRDKAAGGPAPWPDFSMELHGAVATPGTKHARPLEGQGPLPAARPVRSQTWCPGNSTRGWGRGWGGFVPPMSRRPLSASQAPGHVWGRGWGWPHRHRPRLLQQQRFPSAGSEVGAA